MHGDLTNRQRKVLVYIKNHLAAKGYAPSRRDIADHLGAKSTNAAHEHLVALERKGYIHKGDHGVARSLRVLEEDD